MTPPRDAGTGPIVLVGLMGTGKSSVGRLLAAVLGRAFCDSDEQILARTGRTVRELVAAGGPDAHRALESQVLLDAVADDPAPVAAAAAGVVLDPAIRTALAAPGTTVVWLRADPGVLVGRIDDGSDHRPPVPGDLGRWLAAVDAERAPLYASVADLVVDVDTAPPVESAERIIARLSDGHAR